MFVVFAGGGETRKKLPCWKSRYARVFHVRRRGGSERPSAPSSGACSAARLAFSSASPQKRSPRSASTPAGRPSRRQATGSGSCWKKKKNRGGYITSGLTVSNRRKEEGTQPGYAARTPEKSVWSRWERGLVGQEARGIRLAMEAPIGSAWRLKGWRRPWGREGLHRVNHLLTISEVRSSCWGNAGSPG